MKVTITDKVGNETEYNSEDVHIAIEFDDRDLSVLNSRPASARLFCAGSKPDISLKGIVGSLILDCAHNLK